MIVFLDRQKQRIPHGDEIRIKQINHRITKNAKINNSNTGKWRCHFNSPVFTNHLQVFHCYWEGAVEILNLVKVTFSSNKLFITAIHQLCTKNMCVLTSRGICRGVHKVCYLKLKKARSWGWWRERWGNSRPPRKDGGKRGEIFFEMVWHGGNCCFISRLYEWSYGPLVISGRVYTLYTCVKLCVSWVKIVICYWRDTVPRNNNHIFFQVLFVQKRYCSVDM